MAIKKVFQSGKGKAVRSPRSSHILSEQVKIAKRANEIGQRERPENLSAAFELLTSFSSDFFKGGRQQPRLDKRSGRWCAPPRPGAVIPAKAGFHFTPAETPNHNSVINRQGEHGRVIKTVEVVR
jgi:virulence-associated protein VagC